MKTGIYKITNTNNGKVYVGSSIDIDNRLRSHLSNLKRGKHHNKQLLEDFNTFGEHCFELSKIELCDMYEMIDREDYWIEHLDSVNSGYNIMRKSANTGVRKSTKGKQTQASKRRKEMANRQIFCDTMREFVKYKDWDNPQGVKLAFARFNLRDRNGKCSSERLRKFSDAILCVMEECFSLEEGTYKLSHFHYLGGVCRWELQKLEKKTQYPIYTDIYNQLAKTIIDELDGVGTSKYLKDLRNRDIILLDE